MKLRPPVRIPKPWSIQTNPVNAIAIARTPRRGDLADLARACLGSAVDVEVSLASAELGPGTTG